MDGRRKSGSQVTTTANFIASFFPTLEGIKIVFHDNQNKYFTMMAEFMISILYQCTKIS